MRVSGTISILQNNILHCLYPFIAIGVLREGEASDFSFSKEGPELELLYINLGKDRDLGLYETPIFL